MNNRDNCGVAYRFNPEEVRHDDVTAGVKRAWNVITVDKYSFLHS